MNAQAGNRMTRADEQLQDYPSLQDILRSRFMIILLVGGWALGCYFYSFYPLHTFWFNPVNEFLVKAIPALGMLGLFSQVAWRTLFYKFSAHEYPVLSGLVWIGSAIVVAMLMG